MKTFVRTKSFLKSTDFKFEYRKIESFARRNAYVYSNTLFNKQFIK